MLSPEERAERIVFGGKGWLGFSVDGDCDPKVPLSSFATDELQSKTMCRCISGDIFAPQLSAMIAKHIREAVKKAIEEKRCTS